MTPLAGAVQKRRKARALAEVFVKMSEQCCTHEPKVHCQRVVEAMTKRIGLVRSNGGSGGPGERSPEQVVESSRINSDKIVVKLLEGLRAGHATGKNTHKRDTRHLLSLLLEGGSRKDINLTMAALHDDNPTSISARQCAAAVKLRAASPKGWFE